MLADADITATIPVRDLAQSRKFYGGVLGLEEISTDGEAGVFYRSGNGQVYVYASEHAGTNQGTSASWQVADFDSAVRELEAKGVRLEDIGNIPGATRDGNVYDFGTVKAAWFKDPSGNTLNLEG